MRKIQFVILMAFIFFGANSCKKVKMLREGKIRGGEWKPSVALPMVDSKLSVYDILAAADSNNLIVVDENTGLLALVYEGQLFSFEAKDVIPLPDFSEIETVTLTDGEQTQLTTNGSATISNSQTYTYQSASGVSLETINLKDGDLKIDINPSFFFSGSISVNITLPGLTKSGVAFNETIEITNLSNSSTYSFDLTDYIFNLSEGGTTTNSIPVNYTTVFTWTGGTVGSSDNMDVSIGFNGLEFSEVQGDFGQQIVSSDRDSILIRVFAGTSGGTFNLTNPKIHVDIVNSFGFPVDVDFKTLETVLYDQDWNFSGIVPIQYNNQSAPFSFASIAAPSIIGDSVVTSIDINNTNSNIVQLMEPTPKFVHNEVEVISNPLSATGNSNFATDESILRVTSNVELPLEGYSGGWLLGDTIPFEFGDISFEYLDEVLLRVNINNWFPVDAKLQLIALDSNEEFLDSLLTWDNNLINSGIVNATGRVTEPINTMTDFVIDEDRAISLFKASYIVVKATAETNNFSSQEIVQIYEDYTMDVKVGLKIDGSIKVSTGN